VALTWLARAWGRRRTGAPGSTPGPQPAGPPRLRLPNPAAYVGTAKLPADLGHYDRAEGGRPLAQFTGAPTPLSIGPYPAAAGTRTPVATGTGSGASGSTLRGRFGSASLHHAAGAHRADHFWVAGQQAVVVLSGGPGSYSAQGSEPTPVSEFKASGSCDSFSLTARRSSVWSVPGDARGYLIEEDPADLFAAPDTAAAPITSLTGARGLLLWSTKKRGSFVHLVYHGEVIIDAWGRPAISRPTPGEPAIGCFQSNRDAEIRRR